MMWKFVHDFNKFFMNTQKYFRVDLMFENELVWASSCEPTQRMELIMEYQYWEATIET
jgi:hypothetical protein